MQHAGSCPWSAQPRTHLRDLQRLGARVAGIGCLLLRRVPGGGQPLCVVEPRRLRRYYAVCHAGTPLLPAVQ